VSPSLAEAAGEAFREAGVDLASVGLAWARLAPTVAIVPAFGLRAMPGPARAALALLLAFTIAPAVQPVSSPQPTPWAAALVVEAARGVPLAIASAVPLWAATMAGGLADAARGAGEGPQLAVLEGRATPLGALFGLLASLGFLGSGGPARVALEAASLGAHPTAAGPAAVAARVVLLLAHGITIAFSLAAPLIGAAVVVEIAAALAGRAASPSQISGALAPLKGLALLAAAALIFDRLSAALLLLGAASPLP
jgi:type III secretory pathway component EscT